MRNCFILICAVAALTVPMEAKAGRSDFGMGVAATACAMLDAGMSQRKVEKVLDLLERQIMASGISTRQQNQMASGFNFQASRNNCRLRYRY